MVASSCNRARSLRSISSITGVHLGLPEQRKAAESGAYGKNPLDNAAPDIHEPGVSKPLCASKIVK
jgi:hypothetical protein